MNKVLNRWLSSTTLLIVGLLIFTFGSLLILQGKKFSATDANNVAAIQELHLSYQP